jgi:hypothetical protein
MQSKMHLNHFQKELHLPNEILAIIINELASDIEDNEIETLAALACCRLVSHVLCSLATPLLFSSVRLTESLTWLQSYSNLLVFEIGRRN